MHHFLGQLDLFVLLQRMSGNEISIVYIVYRLNDINDMT